MCACVYVYNHFVQYYTYSQAHFSMFKRQNNDALYTVDKDYSAVYIRKKGRREFFGTAKQK